MNVYPNRAAALLSGIVIVLLPLLIILTSLYIFMTSQFIQFEYSQPDFPPSERFTPEQRYYNAVQTVRYVRGEMSLAALQNLGVYNDREIKHLVDVQNVAQGAFVVHALSALLIALALILLVRSPLTRPWAARALVTGAALTVVLIVAIGLFAVLAFDQFFVTFHHIFFAGNSWLFEYTDSLIQFYPEPFWEAAAYGISLFAALTSAVIGVIGWQWGRSLAKHQVEAKAAA